VTSSGQSYRARRPGRREDDSGVYVIVKLLGIYPALREAKAAAEADRDIELTVVVRADNLAKLTSRVDCCAFCLIEQPDGKYALRVERDTRLHGPPDPDALGLTRGAGSLQDRPVR
jgi:hypothetical protein